VEVGPHIRRALIWALLVVGAADGADGGRRPFPDEPSFTLPGLACPYYAATGDLNGDGRADLVVSSWARLPVAGEKYDSAGCRVLVFLQKQGGYRQPADREWAIPSPRAPAVGDFDRDGKNDLAVADGAQWLHLFLGKDELAVDYKNNNCNQYCWGPVAVGRLGGAGVADFLVGPVRRRWLGGAKYRPGYFRQPKGGRPNGSSWLADINYDGSTDVVFLAHKAGQVIRIYYGPFMNLDVSPHELLQLTVLRAPLSVVSLALADVSGDGRWDIVAGTAPEKGAARGKVLVFPQNAPVGFEDAAAPATIISGTGGRVACADLNGDGRTDLVAADYGRRRCRIHVFLQREAGGLPAAAAQADQVLELPDVGPNRGIHMDDVNGDGRPDLILRAARARAPGAVRVFLNRTERE